MFVNCLLFGFWSAAWWCTVGQYRAPGTRRIRHLYSARFPRWTRPCTRCLWSWCGRFCWVYHNIICWPGVESFFRFKTILPKDPAMGTCFENTYFFYFRMITLICICLYIYTCISIFLFLYTFIYIDIDIDTYVFVYVYFFISFHMYMCMYIYIYIHTTCADATMLTNSVRPRWSCQEAWAVLWHQVGQVGRRWDGDSSEECWGEASAFGGFHMEIPIAGWFDNGKSHENGWFRIFRGTPMYGNLHLASIEAVNFWGLTQRRGFTGSTNQFCPEGYPTWFKSLAKSMAAKVQWTTRAIPSGYETVGLWDCCEDGVVALTDSLETNVCWRFPEPRMGGRMEASHRLVALDTRWLMVSITFLLLPLWDDDLE